jgi:hypothetical protein
MPLPRTPQASKPTAGSSVASGGGKKGKKSKQGPPPQVSPARQNKPRRHHLRVEGQNAMTPLAGGGTSSSLVIPSPSRARSLRKASTLSRSARSGVGEPCRCQPVPWPPPPILSRPTTIAGLCRPDLPEAAAGQPSQNNKRICNSSPPCPFAAKQSRCGGRQWQVGSTQTRPPHESLVASFTSAWFTTPGTSRTMLFGSDRQV